ncbi:MAG: hypothetical protein JKY02_00985 [Flavobacteriaceae bacterium]|nr:hypothetical protein [Flavobacteriaceae bacterium]
MGDLLKIYAYSDSARTTQLGVFECFVSPLSLKMNLQNRYGQLNAVNRSIPLIGFSSGGTNTMELTIVLDGTGAYAEKNGEPYNVVEQLIDLIGITMDFNGSMHQPPFLKLIWGQIPVFLCRGEELDVDYKTFNNEGVPVRADVRMVFLEDVDSELSKKVANKESSDLFHQHIVVEHQTLALISYEYYQDTDHLDKIAEVNGLNNLYDCNTGISLLIPPLITNNE